MKEPAASPKASAAATAPSTPGHWAASEVTERWSACPFFSVCFTLHTFPLPQSVDRLSCASQGGKGNAVPGSVWASTNYSACAAWFEGFVTNMPAHSIMYPPPLTSILEPLSDTCWLEDRGCQGPPVRYYLSIYVSPPPRLKFLREPVYLSIYLTPPPATWLKILREPSIYLSNPPPSWLLILREPYLSIYLTPPPPPPAGPPISQPPVYLDR